MTENEKLRGLLAEAQRILNESGGCIDCGIGSQEVWPRIDAALAEPVALPMEPVEWKPSKQSRTREEVWDNGNHYLTVHKHRSYKVKIPWAWYAGDRNRDLAMGYADTLEEAKEAAERAAGIRP